MDSIPAIPPAPSGRIVPPREIRSLTGLRGIAAVLVMLYHFNPAEPVGAIETFLSNGYLWVDLFFMLSGFVMAYTYREHFTTSHWRAAHAAFLVKRLARVYPLYVFVTLESAVSHILRTPSAEFGSYVCALVANLLMVQGWGLASSFEGDAWSISTEWAAYLLFPALASLTLFSSRRWALAASLAAAATITTLALSPASYAFAFQARRGPLDIYSAATVAPLLRCLAEFIVGMVTFRVFTHLPSFKPASCGSVSLSVVFAIILLMSGKGYDVATVALFPLLLLFLATDRGIVGLVLSSRIPYTLGVLSYGIYLIHDKFSRPASALGERLAGHVPFASALSEAVAAVMVVLFASVAYMWVERPCRAIARSEFRIDRTSKGSPAVASWQPLLFIRKDP